MTLLALITLAFLRHVAAVTVGHEQYGNIPGYFYVFTTNSINIVDPVTGTVNKTIASPTKSYGDAVYLEDQAQLRHYVYAARRAENKVIVLDADTQSVLTTVTVGGGPVHLYSLYYNDEVWVHNDDIGSLDVLRMAQVRYRTTSAIKPPVTVPGHGKLLFDPNLEDAGFATNANRGGLLKLSLSDKTIKQTILFKPKSDATGYPCAKTHGISYAAASNSLYVECSNPLGNCTNSPKCTGSIWVMSLTNTSNPTTRLVSPTLAASQNNLMYGMHGQPYRTPEGTFMFVPNANEGIIHILKPMPDGTTDIREVLVDAPGNIMFWPKDSSITFGDDANPENYVMAVNGGAGVSFLDLKVVVAAFASPTGKIASSDLSLVAIETTGGYRTMRRGSNYLVLGAYATAKSAAASRIAIVNIVKRTVKYLNVEGFATAVWVPIQATENTAMIKSLQAKVTSMAAAVSAQSASSSDSSSSSSSSLLTNNALIVAAIAFVLALFAIILIIALGLVVRKRTKSENLL